MTKKRTRVIAQSNDGRYRVVEDEWLTLDGWASSGYRVEGPWINNQRLNRSFPSGLRGRADAIACMREEHKTHAA